MDLAELRSFVWNSLESDSTEVPTSVLDVFIRDGAQKIDDYQDRWDFRAVEYTFSTVASTATYDLDTTSGLTTPAALKSIVSINGPTHQLRQGDHRREREVRAALTSTGTPRVWTQWGRTLYLWPTPTAVETLRIVGYRRTTDWVTSNSTVDYPVELHPLIGWWALSRAHAFLDDADLGQFYADEFYQELANRAGSWLNNPSTQPFQLNGGSPSTEQTQLGPLRWPWL